MFVPSIHNWHDTKSQRPHTSSLSFLLINVAYVIFSGHDQADVPFSFVQDYFSLHLQPSVSGDIQDRLHCAAWVEFTNTCYSFQKPDRQKFICQPHLCLIENKKSYQPHHTWIECMVVQKKYRFRFRCSWIKIPSLPFTMYVTWASYSTSQSCSYGICKISNFQLVCHKNFLNMQYLSIQSRELISFPLDCQTKKKDNSQHNNSHPV